MPTINAGHNPPLGSVLRQPPHLPRNEDLVAFTDELGPVVSLAHWQRADCCDTVVANGAIGWVLSGFVRKSLILESGQRRIVDLMMAGDFFGLRMDDARLFSFEASTDETLTAELPGVISMRSPRCSRRSISSSMSAPVKPSPASRITFWFRAAQPRHRRSRVISVDVPTIVGTAG